MRHFKFCALLALGTALLAESAAAQVDLDQRIFRFARPTATGDAITYDPQNAGYVRMTVDRFRQEANSALCLNRAPNLNDLRDPLAIEADRFSRNLWRRFMKENTSTGTAVRVFTGASANTAPNEQALAVINLTQVVIPPNRNDCRPVTQNGAVSSPLVPLGYGTPTFAARVNRWHDNTLSPDAVANLQKTGSWLGTAAGVPAPVAAALSDLAVSNFRAETEAALGNTAGETFNARHATGGQIVRVFTGYTQPVEQRPAGPAPGWRPGQQSRPRAYQSADTNYPYADIYLTTVASIFDPVSANFDQAKSNDRVQDAVDRSDILKFMIADAPVEMDTLEEILALPRFEAQELAVAKYRQSLDLSELGYRCNDLADLLEDYGLGLSAEDAAVVLLNLARRHPAFGETASVAANQGKATAQTCVQRRAALVQTLGVEMPAAAPARPETVAVPPVERAAMAELLHSVAGAESSATAVSLLGGSGGTIEVRDESLILDGFGAVAQMGRGEFAREFRQRIAEVRCSLPSAVDQADSANEPVTPRSDDPNARTMLAVLKPEDGSAPIIGVFEFDPRAAGASSRVSRVTFMPLTSGLEAKVRESYSACALLPPPPPPPAPPALLPG